jgi:hypothetical protein
MITPGFSAEYALQPAARFFRRSTPESPVNDSRVVPAQGIGGNCAEVNCPLCAQCCGTTGGANLPTTRPTSVGGSPSCTPCSHSYVDFWGTFICQDWCAYPGGAGSYSVGGPYFCGWWWPGSNPHYSHCTF